MMLARLKLFLAWLGLWTVVDTGRAVHLIRQRVRGLRLKSHDCVRGFYKSLGRIEVTK